MIKYIGILMIASVCILSGQILSKRVAMRVRQLELIRLMLELIESEIKYCCPPVEEIIRNLEGRTELRELRFITDCREELDGGLPFPSAFRTSLGKSGNRGALLKEDLELLYSWGNELGTTDSAGQINICRLHKELLGSRLSAAAENKAKQTKMYSHLGVLAGIAAAVLLY